MFFSDLDFVTLWGWGISKTIINIESLPFLISRALGQLSKDTLCTRRKRWSLSEGVRQSFSRAIKAGAGAKHSWVRETAAESNYEEPALH